MDVYQTNNTENSNDTMIDFKTNRKKQMKDDTFVFTEIEIWKPVCYGQQKWDLWRKKMIYDELKLPWN